MLKTKLVFAYSEYYINIHLYVYVFILCVFVCNVNRQLERNIIVLFCSTLIPVATAEVDGICLTEQKNYYDIVIIH